LYIELDMKTSLEKWGLLSMLWLSPTSAPSFSLKEN